jgi:antitoxin HicB
VYYNFKYYKDERGGFWGECLELEGCQSQGKTIEELEKNLKEALDLYLDESPESNVIFNFPEKEYKGENIIKIKPNPNIIFAQQLRILRIKHNLSQEQVAYKMGYKSVWGYQKFERHEANPTLKTLLKIKNIFPEFDLNILI